MAQNNSITASYESLPLIAKLILQFFFGYIIAIVYRVLRYLENKNTTTLIVGLLCIIPIVGFIAWVVDFITEITDNKIKFLAD